MILFGTVGCAAAGADSAQKARDDEFIINKQRPIMHTYFDRIPLERRYTDMTDEDDDLLLEYWKESWREAGWEPRVLSRSDAEKHPYFQEYDNQLKQSISVWDDDFTRICFYRYIAMASVGGGWLSDYDVFPMKDFRTHELPNGGAMTIYDAIRASLASGNASSWLSTGIQLLQNAESYISPLSTTTTTKQTQQQQQQQQPKINFWTDDLGFHNLRRNNTVVLFPEKRVFTPSTIKSTTTQGPLTPDICTQRKMRKPFWVMHFSPRVMLELGIAPELRFPRFRVEAAKAFRKEFSQVCNVTAIVA